MLLQSSCSIVADKAWQAVVLWVEKVGVWGNTGAVSTTSFMCVQVRSTGKERKKQ